MKRIFFTLILTSLPLSSILADDYSGQDFHIDGGETRNVESDTLDIDGDFVQRRESGADRMRKLRRRMEKRNELIVKRKIEKMRLRRELQMMKELEKTFNDQLKKIDQL